LCGWKATFIGERADGVVDVVIGLGVHVIGQRVGACSNRVLLIPALSTASEQAAGEWTVWNDTDSLVAA